MKRPSEQQMAAQRAKLEARLEKQRAALEAKRRNLRRPPKRRWPYRLAAALLLLVLILLCLRDCSCGEAPPPDPEPTAPAEVEPEPEPPAPVKKKPVPPGTIGKKGRPDYTAGTPPPLPWIGAFRMQVAARSTRLSRCFEGVEAPGTLKWTTSVEPVEGTVGEHSLEPMLLSVDLTTRQRDCVLGVLSDPTYTLVTGDDERTTPTRVSMVIEF